MVNMTIIYQWLNNMDDLIKEYKERIKNIQNNIFEWKITDEEMVNLLNRLYKLEKENKKLKELLKKGE